MLFSGNLFCELTSLHLTDFFPPFGSKNKIKKYCYVMLGAHTGSVCGGDEVEHKTSHSFAAHCQ
jgi:hypothetical protein